MPQLPAIPAYGPLRVEHRLDECHSDPRVVSTSPLAISMSQSDCQFPQSSDDVNHLA